jgi:hypothetical protein
MVGTEQVLIEDWCQQYPSHSICSLAFGADGALYVSRCDAPAVNFIPAGASDLDTEAWPAPPACSLPSSSD